MVSKNLHILEEIWSTGMDAFQNRNESRETGGKAQFGKHPDGSLF